jgi:predicted nucleic acid-binding protein
MSRILLDTSAVSALFRGNRAIVERTRTAARIGLSPVTLGELQAGLRRGRRREANQEVLQRLLDSPRVRTLVIDPETADRYAQIYDSLRRAGTPIPTNDMWIAASAMQFGLAVVTTDVHFERVPQIVVEPAAQDGPAPSGNTSR